jgi:hypothetical protein
MFKTIRTIQSYVKMSNPREDIIRVVCWPDGILLLNGLRILHNASEIDIVLVLKVK